MANKRPPRKQWLFHPTSLDEQMVDAERRYLAAVAPGVTITRADAIRSLFARATGIMRAREADRHEADLLVQLASRKGEDLSEVA